MNEANANPYRAPSAALADVADTAELELAGLGHRFGAAMIDQLIASAFILPIGYLTGMMDFTGRHRAPLGTSIIMAAVGFAIFSLLHGYFLARNGQTIGKKIVGIRIVDLDGNRPRLRQALGARYGIVYLFNSLPAIGGLVSLLDILFIFRRDRRCLHDLVAGTKVVMHGAKYSSLTWFVVPLILFLAIAIGAIVIVALVQYQKAKAIYERPKPAASATPASARQVPAPKAPAPDTPAPNPLAPASPDPGHATVAAPPAAANEPAPPATQAPVNQAPPKPQLSEAELRRCLALKDPAAVIRCSQGGK
jgi:uncharacterized RDD family membrane protein YckC